MKLLHLLEVLPWGEYITVLSYTHGREIYRGEYRYARAELINHLHNEVYSVSSMSEGALRIEIE